MTQCSACGAFTTDKHCATCQKQIEAFASMLLAASIEKSIAAEQADYRRACELEPEPVKQIPD